MSTSTQTIVIITAADITDDDRHNFSDMFKECNNFRPRYTPTDQEIADLINAYPRLMEIQAEEEEARLQQLREETGIQFKNWMSYYDYLEGKEVAEWEARKKELAELAAIKAELADPKSPRVAIEFWDHGEEAVIL
jgi:hypothetical protein